MALRGYKGAATVSSRRPSEVAWLIFNEPFCRLAGNADARRACACPAQGEPGSRHHDVFACRWGDDPTPAPLFASCGVDCTLCVGTERDAVNVHRGCGLSGAPSSRILRTHPRELAMPGVRDGHDRVPCPRLPRPLRFGSFWFGTLDDARSRLTGRGRPHGPPSVLDRDGVHPMASARREHGPNSRDGVGRVHAWRVGTDELISAVHAPQAHGMTRVLHPERECDRPRQDCPPSPAIRLGALRDAPGPADRQCLGAVQTQTGARAPPR